MTVSQRQVRVHGQHVTYLEAGAGRGPVVVLVHGLASSSTTWAEVMPLLGRRAHVIAPDLLGHGDSAKPRSGDYSLGAFASSVRDLLVEEDLHPGRPSIFHQPAEERALRPPTAQGLELLAELATE